MIQPNNLRNRWRRMKQTYDAYGWVASSFRDWAAYGQKLPLCYSSASGLNDCEVRLTAARGGLTIFNPKRKRA